MGGLHTPLGLLWLDGSLYVSSKGGVVAYSGFDGSAFAGRRTVVALPSATGEVNGIALAPDGRLWMGISAASDNGVEELARDCERRCVAAARQRASGGGD